MFTDVIAHFNKVMWDEHIKVNGHAMVWHVKLWELYVLGAGACALLYAVLLGAIYISVAINPNVLL